MSDQITYETIENEIMKVLTMKPDFYHSQFSLYEKLLESFDLKDPQLKSVLKDRLFVIFRTLSKYDNVLVHNKDNIYYACFQLEKEIDSIDFILDKEITKESTFDRVQSSIENTDISVARFIVNEKLTQYYTNLDSDGNNILHLLMKSNNQEDIKLVEQIIDFDSSMLMSENLFGKTPFDLIVSNQMSGMIIRKLYDSIIDNNNEIYQIKQTQNNIITNIEGIGMSINIFLVLMSIIYIFYYFRY